MNATPSITQFSTIPDLCRQAAEAYGDSIAIEDGETSLSFVQFDALRRRIAKAFIASGLAKGDRVMIWAPNGWKWFATAMGLVSTGAVLVPCNTRFKETEATELLRRSGAVMAICVGWFLDQRYPDMFSAEARVGLREVVVFDDARAPDIDWDSFLARADGVDDATLERRMASVGPDDLCDLLFTSGTTGHPKGVMYAHCQCLRAIDAWATRVGIRRGDRILVIPPFFHAFGYRSGAIVSLMRGAVLLPHRAYDPDEILRRVARDRVSVIPGPPAIFHGMLQHPELATFDTGCLRLGITGGAVVPSELIRRMRTDLGFACVVNGYGLTECGGYGAMCRADDDDETIASTAGKPLPETELAILDERGRAAPDGERGEIAIRGYLTMRGYFNDPEATRRTIDENGWLHTGDVGYLDENGNLRIEDRLKDMYITGGFNCYPAEIERLLSAHPAVGQIAVIGVPDDRLGEVGKAFVVLRPGASATADELIAWARKSIANYKAPRSIEFMTSLPISPQGKVVKDRLRELSAQG